MGKELKFYWCVRVNEEISEEKEIYIHADVVEVKDGDLIFRKQDGLPVFAISKGNWKVFFAASLWDGHAVHVEHWKGFQESKN